MRPPSLRAALSVTVTVVVLSACGDAGQGSQPTYDFAAFEQALQGFVDEKPDIDGVGAIVVQRDRGVVYQRSFGAFANDRVYLLASSSKMITAGVLMRLADDGLLDLDQPIASVVPWAQDHPTITPAQLISNSSGLVGLRPDPAFGPYLCQFVYSGTLQECAQRILTTAGDDQLVVPPDTQYRYGGAQWQVAGAVAEVVSGRSWSDLVREIYVDPCGLEALGYNNHFVQLPGSQGSYPLEFASNPERLQQTDNPNMEGGAYTSIGDYGKLLLMHLRGGMCGDQRVLSEAAVRRTHQDRIVAYGGATGTGFEGYGFGWWVDRDNPSLVIDPGAYGAYAWLDEERGYGAFLAIEATSGLGTELFVRVLPVVTEAIDAAR